MLKGKKILVGVTGSIAAYKSAVLIRRLVSAGAEVKVIATELAKQFITPLTLATLSKNPLLVDFFNPENGEWHSHVKLGLWADAYVIAPATANTMAKMAGGIADNLLLTTYLSARCPVFVAPAMDLDMYNHPATRRNMERLVQDGVHIIEPASGELASGLTGKGRMEEPEVIAERISQFFASPFVGDALWGKKVVITAGGTVEPIDAVRFISNRSSGKMGYALADRFRRHGATVTLIRGAVDPRLPGTVEGVCEIGAGDAEDMARKTMAAAVESDVIVMAAAVADYTPESVSDVKIKKQGDDMTIRLRQTRDIAASVGAVKRPSQVLVGFALETDNEEANALDKMRRKRLDMIVLNSLRDKGAGFGCDTNKVTIYRPDGTRRECDLKSKSLVADDIVNEVIEMLERAERADK
ncbi:MAG: bifunctional phosphopantothenoylcysteine decarboxylase/phosphopantothenate--cysteine ligase CoaBC [Rikenellaceae bacterium]|nr:bifunctional phosphopantothenoylcysteine decarboxylase/phosphopantothenate--cysteine ligase CoaBC [Rikenellaceae bacterium]